MKNSITTKVIRSPNDIDNIYVAMTHFSTFLSYDLDSGNIFHSAGITDRTILCRNDCDLSLAGGCIEKTQDGCVTIRLGEKYASADPCGSIVQMSQVRGWETFRLVPISTIWKQRTIQTFYPQNTIPRLIHQTYPEKQLPEDLGAAVDDLKSRNQRWSHYLWSDADIEDFIHDEYGVEILRYYLRINREYGAARADFFRYLCVYKKGGCYLDVKSTANIPLSHIVRPQDNYLLSNWDNAPDGKRPGFGLHRELRHIPKGEFEQWHLIAAPGHPYLENVINRVLLNIFGYEARRHGVGRAAVLRLTGPIAYSLAVAEVHHVDSHRLIIAENEGLCYRTVANHKRYFSSHYSELQTPIVI